MFVVSYEGAAFAIFTKMEDAVASVKGILRSVVREQVDSEHHVTIYGNPKNTDFYMPIAGGHQFCISQCGPVLEAVDLTIFDVPDGCAPLSEV